MDLVSFLKCHQGPKYLTIVFSHWTYTNPLSRRTRLPQHDELFEFNRVEFNRLAWSRFLGILRPMKALGVSEGVSMRMQFERAHSILME